MAKWSQSFSSTPTWLLQAIIGLILSSMIAWATWSTSYSETQATRISVVEAKHDATREDIKEIKATLLRIDEKIERALRGSK